jgi:formylglycine-generating enzyme required for sulfatase activity
MAEQDNSNLAIEATPFARADTNGEKKKLALKPIPIALGSVFLALALSAMFMFTAKAVRFNISPAPESFNISKGFFSYQLGERFLMLSGEYEITARLTGYKDLLQAVTVGGDADQNFDFQMSKLPGILLLNTEPPVEAEIFIDQVSVGLSPVVIDEIEAGLHDISIQSERYLPYETEILIEGLRIEQALSATLEPAWAEVTFVTLPPAAEVSVDNIPGGTTPVTIEILEGTRQLEIKKSGYKIWQSEINVIHGQHVELPEVTLIKSDGKVAIKTNPPGVNITIGKRYRGQSPLSVTLAPGKSYDVLLSKAGYEQITRTIQVEPEQDVSLNLTLKPVVGVIRLQVQPAGGELFLDGKPAGEPTQQLTLTASRHIIEVRKEGYATYKTTVTPRPGLSQQLLITLQTDDEARTAAIPQQITTSNGDELKLILPGELKMGAGRRERGRRSNEIQKDVLLTRPYYLGVREVTNKQFKAFKPGHDSGVFGRALLTENDRPVVNISWYSAAQYCNWLSEQEGLPVAYEQKAGKWKIISPATTGYRMPSEAEWAWAARYATASLPLRFPWGDAMPPLEGAGNFADEAAAGMVPYHIVGYKDAYRGPAPVGSYTSNELGIHDLAGNVSEWISDYYSVELEREQLIDPMGPEHGDYYVIRGSNYTNGRFSELRWTFRDYGAEPRRDVGFRIARYLEPVDKE